VVLLPVSKMGGGNLSNRGTREKLQTAVRALTRGARARADRLEAPAAIAEGASRFPADSRPTFHHAP